jgi:hypothetical protein
MIKQVMGAAMALCIASSASAATLRLKSYLAPEDEKQRVLNEIFLDGIKDGLIAYNVATARTGAAPLFCLPPNMVLTPEQAGDIVTGQAKLHPYPDDMIVSIVLLGGLRKTYPSGAPGGDAK